MCVNELVDCGLPLAVRQFAELHFGGLNDACDGAAGQKDAVVGVAGVLFAAGRGLFQPCLQVGGHLGG